MKLDYEYIKKLLKIIEEYPKHEINCEDLLVKLEINIDTDEDAMDKFLGHIKILGDDFFIESSGTEYGFEMTLAGRKQGEASYRLTSKGYEFLDVLKNDTAFNKIKNFALSSALDIGKQIIVEIGSKILAGGM